MDALIEGFLARVESLAESLLESQGIRLVDLEYKREPRGWVLRLYIDRPGGVTLGDCADVSNQLGDVLDAKISGDHPYHIEVSSPGLERPLTKPKHFACFEGRSAVIKTGLPVGGKDSFTGVLAGFSEGVVKLMVGDEPVHIPYDMIAKARLVMEPKPGPLDRTEQPPAHRRRHATRTRGDR